MCEFLCRKVLLNVGGVRHEVQWKMLEQVRTIFLFLIIIFIIVPR